MDLLLSADLHLNGRPLSGSPRYLGLLPRPVETKVFLYSNMYSAILELRLDSARVLIV